MSTPWMPRNWAHSGRRYGPDWTRRRCLPSLCLVHREIRERVQFQASKKLSREGFLGGDQGVESLSSLVADR